MEVLYWFAAYILIGSIFTLVGTLILVKHDWSEYDAFLVPIGALWPLFVPLAAAYAFGMYLSRKLREKRK